MLFPVEGLLVLSLLTDLLLKFKQKAAKYAKPQLNTGQLVFSFAPFAIFCK